MVALVELQEDLACAEIKSLNCVTEKTRQKVVAGFDIELEVNFPFAKKLRTGNEHVLVMMSNARFVNIPDDLENVDSLGNIQVDPKR